ncbi:4a-hydroxytetrahydrobiopterin dehydratase [Aurantivibrio plasticivorans]
MQPFTFFISYRRQDTAPIALLLKNEIEKRLQFVRVSVDVEELAPGEHFPDRLKGLIDGAHATIVLIGNSWMPEKESAPISVDTDWVTKEIEYSRSAPMLFAESDRFGLSSRTIIPLFADCDRDYTRFALPPTIAFLADLQSERIDYAGWPTAVGPLVDRIAVRLSLKRRPDADEYPKPDLAKARTQPLPDVELAQILKYDDYDGWYVDNFGNAEVRYLAKTFKFRNFDQAAEFMQLVAEHCHILDHHPEWRNVFNHVTVSLTTWDAHRKITIYDLNLALYMNMAAKAVVKRS